MCIKTEFVEKTLTSIRKSEKQIDEMQNRDLCETLAKIKKIQDEMETAETRIKKQLKDRGYNSIEMFPEIESKVYLAEGRKTSEYDVQKIYEQIPVEKFVQIVTIGKGKVDELNDNLVSEIVVSNSISKISEPSIAVRKMSKTELKEAL